MWRIMFATFFSLFCAWILLCVRHALRIIWWGLEKRDLGLDHLNLLQICHMEAMSIHYPSTCQTVCKGAAVYRRPANWFDTGEKWCMIALANLSVSLPEGFGQGTLQPHQTLIPPPLQSLRVSPHCYYLDLESFPHLSHVASLASVLLWANQ